MAYKIGMISLGCEKNRVDAEMLLYSLNQAGYTITDNVSTADAVIVNTCAFIEAAKEESINEILELATLKNEGKIKAIIVTGCLAERYKTEVMKEIYEIDAVVGLGSYTEICSVVEKALNGEKSELYGDKMLLPMEGGRIQSTPRHFSYIKTSDGCNNRCAYCAIPLIRGNFRSRKMENIVEEAEHLAANGVKELIVIAQDTTLYGKDIYGKLMLPELLKRLCKIEGLNWIRLQYCYPDKITDELLDTIAAEEKILNYIDLPIQHCSEHVLKSMNRKGSRSELTALVKRIRDKIPDAILRTSIIVGFPGETEQDFTELTEFLKEVKFERLGCFIYSREEDTPAYDMDNQVSQKVAKRRQDIILNNQIKIMDEYNKSLIGKKLTVITEGFDVYSECYFGRSYADSPDVDGKVFFNSDKNPKAGDFAELTVTDSIGCDIIGEY